MNRHNVRIIATAGVALLAACKGDGPTPPPGGGTVAKIVEVNPASHSGLANTILGGTIVVAVQDSNSVGLANRTVLFEVLNGGGALIGKVLDTTDANGHATAPQWRLGKSANQQTLRVFSGPVVKLDIDATIQTNYNIVVRFFNASMTPAQQALFTSAAQRIRGIVTSDMADLQLSNFDVSSCLGQAPGTTVLTEIVDDIIVYASIDSIDGPGNGTTNVLARAQRCVVRGGATHNKITAVGMMLFDENDIASISGSGSFQEVILHEMIHLLGIGFWGSCTACFPFLDGEGGPDPQYNQPAAKAACLDAGGSVTCLNGVPVANTGGAGSRDSHWRETSFNNELMTPSINASPNPFSAITIGGIADLGYTVNTADNDAYTLPALMANLGAPNFGMAPQLPANWEQLDGVPVYSVDEKGKVRLLR